MRRGRSPRESSPIILTRRIASSRLPPDCGREPYECAIRKSGRVESSFMMWPAGRVLIRGNMSEGGVIRKNSEKGRYLMSCPDRDSGSPCTAGLSGWNGRKKVLVLEVTVLATQTTIDTLAVRIERAYLLRRSSWHRGSTTSKVWSIAASALVQLHQEDPSIPVDPELYVAVQPVGRAFDDPWTVLVQPEAARRYRRRFREMIRGLRNELRGEIRSAERRIGLGESLRSVLETPGVRMSAL